MTTDQIILIRRRTWRGYPVRGRWFMGLALITMRWYVVQVEQPAPEYLNIEHAASVVLHKTISVSMALGSDRGLRWESAGGWAGYAREILLNAEEWRRRRGEHMCINGLPWFIHIYLFADNELRGKRIELCSAKRCSWSASGKETTFYWRRRRNFLVCSPEF